MKTRFAVLAIVVFLVTTRPAQASSGEVSAVPEAASRSLELINRERAAAGLPSLALDHEVNGIAAGWSRKLASDGRLSHNDDYLSQESMRRLDATIVGENVAYSDTVDSTHELFMQSPPHRRNILHPDYRLVGIAAVRAVDGQIYLTQNFLTRRSKTAGSPANARPSQPRHRPEQARARPATGRPRPAAARPRPAAPRPRPAAGRPQPAAARPRPATTRPRSAATEARRAAKPPRPAPVPPPPVAAPLPAPEAPSPTAAAPLPAPDAPSPAAAAPETATRPEPPAASLVTVPTPEETPGSTVRVTEGPVGTEGPAGDSSPWSRATLLRAAPLLGLALRPRWARLRG
ncbi:MAG: CAP domain-containing protein [Actinomycetota bacterium]